MLAEAARVCAVQAGDDTPIANAVETKLHAKQRAGQMLSEGKKTGDLKKGGDQNSPTKASRADIGITHNESSQWQKLASVPERKFEKAIEAVKKRDPVLTEAAVKQRSLTRPSEYLMLVAPGT